MKKWRLLWRKVRFQLWGAPLRSLFQSRQSNWCLLIAKRMRSVENHFLMRRAKIAERILPDTDWPTCPRCNGGGGVVPEYNHWREFNPYDPDDVREEIVMCEFCDGQGQASPTHTQEYMIGTNPVQGFKSRHLSAEDDFDVKKA